MTDEERAQSNAKDRRIREQRAEIKRMQSEIDTLHSRLHVYIRWHEETTAVLAAAFSGVPLDELKDDGYALRHAQDMLDFHERVRAENFKLRGEYRERIRALSDELPEPFRTTFCTTLERGMP